MVRASEPLPLGKGTDRERVMSLLSSSGACDPGRDEVFLRRVGFAAAAAPLPPLRCTERVLLEVQRIG